MASTYSDLKFELIGTGEQSGTWGVTTNTNLGTAIEEAITGSADVTFASAQVTLTLTDTNASQTARNLRLNLTGTSGGAQNLIVPTIEKFYLVNNGCADAITVKNSTGTGIAVPAGKAMLVFNDATNVVDAVTHFNTASVGTLTLTNALAVAQGGTGATTADGALDNLGGTTVGKNLFKAATAAAAQQAMDTEVGVDVQAYDADLTAIGGLAKTDGNFIVGNGSTWVAESGATARTSLGLGALATLSTVDASTITDNSVGAAELNVSGNGTSGQLLASDGDGTMTWTTVSGGGDYALEVFNNPGTWTKPADVTAVKVTVIGGGGGGGGAKGNPEDNRAGKVGGGGGSAVEYLDAPAVPGPVAVTVGNGGTAGPAPATQNTLTAGGAGGTSSFGAFVSATGGGGAQGAPTAPLINNVRHGNGGAGSGGNLNIVGGAGDTGNVTTINLGSQTMIGGTFNVYNPSANNTYNGHAGALYGGGGGGGSSLSDANNPKAGGVGGKGVVIVEWWK